MGFASLESFAFIFDLNVVARPCVVQIESLLDLPRLPVVDSHNSESASDAEPAVDRPRARALPHDEPELIAGHFTLMTGRHFFQDTLLPFILFSFVFIFVGLFHFFFRFLVYMCLSFLIPCSFVDASTSKKWSFYTSILSLLYSDDGARACRPCVLTRRRGAGQSPLQRAQGRHDPSSA